MEDNKPKDSRVSKPKITTIKLSETTKARIDHLKLYPRETYEEIMSRILEILNTCRVSPERARINLLKLEKERKRNKVGTENLQVSKNQQKK